MARLKKAGPAGLGLQDPHAAKGLELRELAKAAAGIVELEALLKVRRGGGGWVCVGWGGRRIDRVHVRFAFAEPRIWSTGLQAVPSDDGARR
jgi:hypothetical protein